MLERMKIMGVIFEDDVLIEKYPDIKVIKELKPLKVICFCDYGKWCRKNNIKATRKQWLEECEHNNWKTTGKIQCLYLYYIALQD